MNSFLLYGETTLFWRYTPAPALQNTSREAYQSGVMKLSSVMLHHAFKANPAVLQDANELTRREHAF